MTRVLLTFLAALIFYSAHAQDSTVLEEGTESVPAPAEIAHELVAPVDLQTTRQYREDPISVEKFNVDKWKVVVGNKDYSENAVKEQKSEPMSLTWAGPVMKVVAYIVVIGLVIFLLYYVANNITFALRIERDKLQTEDLEKPVENIDSLDIESLLAQARKEKNFRMAIRLYYLGLLKKLNTAGVIVWKKDKTNRDYLSELLLKDFHYKEIQWLTVSYEEVWYGEHSLKGDSLESLAGQFENAYREINPARI